jgi:hypothetical protein
MDNCSHNKDLNPYTCRFVQKCKDNFERDENFKCKKKVTFKLKVVKPKNNTRKIPYIESPILNVSTPESLLFENDRHIHVIHAKKIHGCPEAKTVITLTKIN